MFILCIAHTLMFILCIAHTLMFILCIAHTLMFILYIAHTLMYYDDLFDFVKAFLTTIQYNIYLLICIEYNFVCNKVETYINDIIILKYKI